MILVLGTGSLGEGYEYYYRCLCSEGSRYAHILPRIDSIPFWSDIVLNFEEENRRIFSKPEESTIEAESLFNMKGFWKA